MQGQDVLLQPLVELADRTGELCVVLKGVTLWLGHLFRLEFRQSG